MSNTYPVNEMFETIQGEASFTGTPAVFIRLQGCPVGCSWCDTKHTWDTKPENVIPIATMIDKTEDAESYADMSVLKIVASLNRYRAKHIVITGGEPCIHDLKPLTKALIASGKTCQIETSGTHQINCDPACFVTLSPKVDMAGGFKVLKEAYKRADEIKWPVGKEKDIEQLLESVGSYKDPIYKRKKRLIYLQPLSQSPKATKLCIDMATKHNWRVSIQTHKFLNLR